MKKKSLILATTLTTALLGGCGMYQKSSDSAPKTTAAVPGASTPTLTADGVLIGPDGRTLYVFARDVAGNGQSNCNDTCAVNWPPLAVSPTAKPIADYTIITRADGKQQWAYKGMPLYYFIKDTKSGDRTGDGVGGNWKVARP